MYVYKCIQLTAADTPGAGAEARARGRERAGHGNNRRDDRQDGTPARGEKRAYFEPWILAFWPVTRTLASGGVHVLHRERRAREAREREREAKERGARETEAREREARERQQVTSRGRERADHRCSPRWYPHLFSMHEWGIHSHPTVGHP